MEHVEGICKESEEDMEFRRGPWTVEEDFTLINHIAHHGEGRWNSLARSAGLKRTGKSCRLRWLNYLRPDVRRGNITLEEQLLILELHCQWGNRWSKIAQYLPGRTDNEIKNYWRTRVQKHAKQLKCDVNSKQFKDTMRYLWMPRLVERIQAAATAASSSGQATNTTANYSTTTHHHLESNHMNTGMHPNMPAAMQISYMSPENSSTPDSFRAQAVSPVSDLTDCYNCPTNQDFYDQLGYGVQSTGYFNNQDLEYDQAMDQNNQWCLNGCDDVCDNLFSVEDMWFLQQQLSTNVSTIN